MTVAHDNKIDSVAYCFVPSHFHLPLRFSSKRAHQLQRNDALAWFGGADKLRAFHHGVVNGRLIAPLIKDDFV